MLRPLRKGKEPVIEYLTLMNSHIWREFRVGREPKRNTEGSMQKKRYEVKEVVV
jgi:hypothetical protein